MARLSDLARQRNRPMPAELAYALRRSATYAALTLKPDRRLAMLSDSDAVDVTPFLSSVARGLDLPEAKVMRAGDGLVLQRGGYVAVEADNEALVEIAAASAASLARLAWHLSDAMLSDEKERVSEYMPASPILKHPAVGFRCAE